MRAIIDNSYQMKPLEGAESEGAKGFFKGVGKGLIGCVNKHEAPRCSAFMS